MATTLQIVNPTDLTTVLWDFNDSTGVNNAGGVKTFFGLGGAFNLGGPATEFTRFQPRNQPGGSTVFSRDALVQSAFRSRMVATSYDNLTTGAGALARAMRAGGVMKYIASGSALTKYIDFEPSEPPAILVGGPLELYFRMGLFDSPDGIEIRFTRQPTLRVADLDPTVNLLANALLLEDYNLDGTPDAWAWDSTANITGQAISAPDERYKFVIAIAAARNLQQSTAAATWAPGDVGTFSFVIRATGGANAKAQAVLEFMSSGNIVQATATGPLTTLTGVDQQLSITSAAAPAVTDHVRVSLRMNNGDATSYTVYPGQAQLEKSSTVSTFRVPPRVVSNDPGATSSAPRVFPLLILGDAPALVRFKITKTAGADPTDLVLVADRWNLGLTGKRSLTDLLNARHVLQSEGGVFGIDTSAVADALASGGNAAQVTFATVQGLAKRVTHSPATLLDALRGAFDVWVRVLAITSAQSYTLQLQYALNSAGATSTTLPSVTTGSIGLGAYRRFNLGTIVVPTTGTLAGLNFDIYAAGPANQALNIDCIEFVPRDQQTQLRPATNFSLVTNNSLSSDPGIFPPITVLDSAGAVYAPGYSNGPAPFWLPPGLHLIVVGNAHSDNAFVDGLTLSLKVAATYAPRYYH